MIQNNNLADDIEPFRALGHIFNTTKIQCAYFVALNEYDNAITEINAAFDTFIDLMDSHKRMDLEYFQIQAWYHELLEDKEKILDKAKAATADCVSDESSQ
uniref:TPR_REGION domain-containing protein n=1 Tax=Parastrongyloides trichosuri TaxID=131310 RepID=A0A0N4ZBN6_PARTI